MNSNRPLRAVRISCFAQIAALFQCLQHREANQADTLLAADAACRHASLHSAGRACAQRPSESRRGADRQELTREMIPRPMAKSFTRRATSIAVPLLISAILSGTTSGLANAQSPIESFLLGLGTPEMIADGRRDDAILKGLALFEVAIAARHGYRDPEMMGKVMRGDVHAALRRQLLSGGPAAEIAGIIFREGDRGMFGDPRHAVKVTVGAVEGNVISVVLPRNVEAVTALQLQTPDYGELRIDTRCSAELHERRELEAAPSLGIVARLTSSRPLLYRLDRTALTLGVVAGRDCASGTVNLSLSWAAVERENL